MPTPAVPGPVSLFVLAPDDPFKVQTPCLGRARRTTQAGEGNPNFHSPALIVDTGLRSPHFVPFGIQIAALFRDQSVILGPQWVRAEQLCIAAVEKRVQEKAEGVVVLKGIIPA